MAEVYQLDLDEELLSHLVIPESLNVIRHEGIAADLIEDPEIEKVFLWQMEHGREHKQFATITVVADEFDLDFEEPETAIGDLLERLRDRYVKNHAREKLEKVSEAYKEDPMLVVKVLPQVAREFQAVVGARGESYGTGDYDAAMSKISAELRHLKDLAIQRVDTLGNIAAQLELLFAGFHPPVPD